MVAEPDQEAVHGKIAKHEVLSAADNFDVQWGLTMNAKLRQSDHEDGGVGVFPPVAHSLRGSTRFPRKRKHVGGKSYCKWFGFRISYPISPPNILRRESPVAITTSMVH